MLRFKIKEMIARKEFDEGRRITIAEVAKAAGIHRMTLSKLINQKGYNAGTDTLDRLCGYFQCKIEELVEHIPDPEKIEKNADDE
ncbi:MAG TPA: XRE family transcriptional regulator [Gammaproteobacteria bacterium]|nr:XRE family transcriptional regulator [Gammaproteobacteria bacterium]